MQVDKFPGVNESDPPRLGKDLPNAERKALLTERIKAYAQRVYKRVASKPVSETRIAGVCQRENGFYIDTVRSFRDRRYEYKGLVKKWKCALAKASEAVRLSEYAHVLGCVCTCMHEPHAHNPACHMHDIARLAPKVHLHSNQHKVALQDDKAALLEAQDMTVLYDSLQLAHKCILNSFYGYVMRAGARWYSMEMAGVTTYTGAKIIERACGLIERIGRCYLVSLITHKPFAGKYWS